MTSSRPELPDDIESCHVLIEQLRAELHGASEQIAKLQSATCEDASAHIGHLEVLLAESQETIAVDCDEFVLRIRLEDS